MYSEFSDRGVVTTVNQSSIAPPSGVWTDAQSPTVNNSGSPDRRIQVVVMMLESNSHKEIGIEVLPRLVNLSPGRLAHLFKSEMELSIQQYLTQLRLAQAKNQLESTFLSIKEIAASVGFSSVTRFVVCFKNVVGTTPTHYRKHFLSASYRGRRSCRSKISKEIAESKI